MSFLKHNHLAPSLVLIVCIIHAYPFLTGFRLTADDVAYHWYAMNGIAESWQFIKSAAIGQGRIVHFPDLVTSLVGAYYADNLLFRIFYIILYFLNFGLFAFYINKIHGANAGWFFFLVLIVLHPLDYFHMSPGAYPFKISIPIFIILLSRLAVLYLRNRDPLKAHKEIPWLVLCFFAMMFSEYAFAFALSLMIIEFSARAIAYEKFSKSNWIHVIIKSIASRQTWQDLVLISAFLILYVGFRLIFPSSYEGNRLPEGLDLLLFLKTLVGHIFGGSVFSSFVRYEGFGHYFKTELSWIDYLSLTLLLIATFLSAFLLLHAQCQNADHIQRVRKIKLVSTFSLFLALIVTAPVAITTKYQSWCVEIDSCIFLDSSLSYLGFASFLAGLLVIIAKISKRKGAFGLFALSALLACTAAAGQLNNLRLESSMSEYVQGWERAKALSCYSEVDLAVFSDLSRLVEPIPRISFHPQFDVRSYWHLYIKDQKKRGICETGEDEPKDFFSKNVTNKKVYFSSSGAGNQYIATGWSFPEQWGIWSSGDRAEIVLPLKPNHHIVLIEANAFIHKSHPFQRVGIVINGKEIDNFTLTKTSGNLIEINFAEALISERPLPRFAIIQFIFKDAVSPLQLGLSSDNRKLAIGLTALEIR